MMCTNVPEFCTNVQLATKSDREPLGALDALLAFHRAVPELLFALLDRRGAQAGGTRRGGDWRRRGPARWWGRLRLRRPQLEGPDVAGVSVAASQEAPLVSRRAGGEGVVRGRGRVAVVDREVP